MTDTLHVGQAILDWMRDTARPADKMPWKPADAHHLYGLPVALDPDLRPGAWQLRDGDHVISSGEMPGEEPGRTLVYVPRVGFLSLADIPLPDIRSITISHSSHIDPITEHRWLGLDLPGNNLSWLKITEMGTGA